MSATATPARYRHLLSGTLPMLALAARLAAAPLPEPTPEQREKWSRFWEEQQALELLLELSEQHRPAPSLAVVGATVIPMTGAASLLTDATVVVEDGRIRTVGPRNEVAIPDRAVRVAGAGRFLVPGLADAHTHTIHSPSQLLVYLTRGVTTLREMDGYPWMLAAREKAARGELLMPHLYVSGHILSHRAWEFYMTQVDTADQVRRLVAEQAAEGYDFVKIHNSMPEPLFGAVFEAAAEAGLDVVGHIPNEISIAHAIAAGMRTNEHFKGYLFDQTLEITDQDYVGATRGAELWNAPSFVTYHDHLRGAQAREAAERENSLRLVPRWLEASWQRQADQPVDRLTELRQSIYPKSRQIFADLLPVTDRFLAGTDTGSYAFMVPGYALQEEVRIFEELGLSPADALATATRRSAEAMRRQSEFGSIAPGLRGDLLLLDENPLETTAHLAGVRGVSVRGAWLDRAALDDIEQRLGRLFSEATPVPELTRASLADLIGEAGEIEARGFPYPRYILSEIRDLATELGQEDLAAEAARLMTRKAPAAAE